MAKWGLVMFDHDGFTGVIETKKLRSKSDSNIICKADQADMTLGAKTYLVEVLELADTKSALNQHEKEWLKTHRAFAVQAERERREAGDGEFGGFLEIWPTDTNRPKQTTNRRRKQTSPAQDEVAPKKVHCTQVNEGLNGRKVTVLYQGSGDYSNNPSEPGRQPNYIEDLTTDQHEILQMQINSVGRTTRFMQTDDVLIFNSSEELMKYMGEICTPASPILNTLPSSPTCKPVSQPVSLTPSLESYLTKTVHMETQTQPSVLFSQMRASTNDFSCQVDSSNSVEKKLDEIIKLQRLILQQTQPRTHDDLLSDTELFNTTLDQTFITKYTVPISSTTSFQNSVETPSNIQPFVFPDSHIPTNDAPQQDSPTPAACTSAVQSIMNSKKPKAMGSCFIGPIFEIEQPSDLRSAEPNTEVRVKPDKLREVKDKSVSDKNFGWNLVKLLYSGEEITGRNFWGKKGRLGLSPRRRHAIEHGICDVYGHSALQNCITGINTGIRNYK